KVPPADARVGIHRAGDMSGKVRFRARRAARRLLDLTAHHIEIDDKGSCAMSDILMFAASHLSTTHGKTRMFALQCLHSGHFIDGKRALVVLSKQWSQFIGSTNRSDDAFPLWVLRRREPVAYPMRLQIGFF